MPPDQILHSGIRVLQQKLATVIQELQQSGENGQQTNGATSRPDMMDTNMGNGTAYGGNTAYGAGGGLDQGWNTPAVNAGGNSAWGGGGTTPYGATPYGRNGDGNW